MGGLLVVDSLEKHFREADHEVFAVNGVSFDLAAGEALGLVGESGCGKTTVARCVVKLAQATKGKILFQGLDVTHLSDREFRPLRKKVQMVFQDPTLSLNPRFTVRRTLSEPLRIHRLVSSYKELEERLLETVSLVGLERIHLDRYAHQLSGGQKQRVGIARAIACRPELVALDEPTSSLDMNVRVYILDLLHRLQEELGMTYLFISHDLSTVRYLCNRVMVMYLGKVVETAEVEVLFSHPAHPYTGALFSAVPIPDPGVHKQRIILPGETPSLTERPAGCVFRTRCVKAQTRCKTAEPRLVRVAEGHWVACFEVGR